MHVGLIKHFMNTKTQSRYRQGKYHEVNIAVGKSHEVIIAEGKYRKVTIAKG